MLRQIWSRPALKEHASNHGFFLLFQVSFLDRALEFVPSLMIMGLIYWMFRQQMRNMPGGLGGAGPLGRAGKGGNGRGGGGFFGMARANVKEVDKNAKDKVGWSRRGSLMREGGGHWCPFVSASALKGKLAIM